MNLNSNGFQKTTDLRAGNIRLSSLDFRSGTQDSLPGQGQLNRVTERLAHRKSNETKPKTHIARSMKQISRAATMQRLAFAWREEGKPIALVPTMGFLHSGHGALIKRARKAVGKQGSVVVSLFVNPTQFAPDEDFDRYPRSEKEDLKLCREFGADVVFSPSVDDIYPSCSEIPFTTFISEETLSRPMEGSSRPTHFRGVLTVVAILFNIVQPSHALFGEKDFQQVAVIKKMVQDLRYPIKVIIGKTIRDRDGLAVSSRNAYLSVAQRQEATVLWQCIQAARDRVNATKTPYPATRLRTFIEKKVNNTPGATLDYVEFFASDSLQPVKSIRQSHRIALAVRFGKTRLIDNGEI
ncbi:pantoate--beta-alanine ligase [Verrucomicrobia bacterium]|nr:pantoate--beta-alanine ligase [Verrucomicrobiota bacterium]